ncbi:MAG: glutamate 5-kinase [Campylobacter sp.]|nr:glutamate 5-kinase [Campylobacter sp.]
MDRKELLGKLKRVVVKIGTSTLTKDNGELNDNKIKSIVANIAKLSDMGYDVLLVTSGAVGAGMGELSLSERPKTLSEKQALAAVGQVSLIHLYQILFWAHSKSIAQLLLTKGDFNDRNRYLNMRNVCNSLLAKKIIPVINENDPVVSDELKVGDNDTLSALVAGLIDADLLIILSDIDGLYDKNPSVYKDANFINLVEKIDENIAKMADGEGSKFGTGGMKTKIIAATMATKIGTNLIIANGENPENIVKAVNGENIGTLFLRRDKKISSKKYWLGYGASKKGVLRIDEGAANALKNGKSLLSVGIKDVSGKFERGQIVEIADTKNKAIAKGISNYSSAEILCILGEKSERIGEILGHKYDNEVVHIDNIVLI